MSQPTATIETERCQDVALPADEDSKASGATALEYVQLFECPLEGLDWYSMMRSPSAGAVSSFIGTTRDHFAGKQVLRLEYEAYEKMALKEMQKLKRETRERWGEDIVEVLIWHRLGNVPVTEASCIIAVTSVHRKSGLEAVHWLIDELKARVPIWKKEFYTDGSVWKSNAEFDPVSLTLKSSCCSHHGGEAHSSDHSK